MRLLILIPFLIFSFGCASVRISKEKEVKSENNIWVRYVEYTPKGDSLKRGVIIVPPTGGVNFIDRSYAKNFAGKGATVKVLSDWKKPDAKRIDLNLHEDYNQAAVKAISALADTFPKDYSIALLGTSEGGMYAQLAAVHVDRIKTVLVIGSGAPIREIIATSKYETMTNLKRARFEKYKFKTDEEYSAAIKPAFPMDDNYSKIANSKKLGVIYMSKDEDVPAKTQRQLVEMWRPKYSRELKSSHFGGIFKSWYFYDDEIRDFLIKD